jgi:Ankyrin repeats (3 copies)
MDSLISQPTVGHIKRTLQNLPRGEKGLDETYKQAMRRIEGQDEGYRELARQVLSWITYAKKPLTTAELRHALAVKDSEGKLDEDFIPNVEILDSVCAGLVTIEKNSDIIQLVHYTTQEYFKRTSSFPNAETDMTVTCVTYLSFDTFAAGFCPTEEEFEARLQLNPLYNYAARNWGHHARAASTEVEQLILDFLDSAAKVSASSQAMMAPKRYWSYLKYSQEVTRQMTGVHLAAYFGLEKVTTTLLKNGYDPDPKDSHGRTPLSWAAKDGHEAVVRLLLAKDGVDPDSKDGDGQTTLSWAAANGHEAVVRLLLAKDGVDLDSKDYV